MNASINEPIDQQTDEPGVPALRGWLEGPDRHGSVRDAARDVQPADPAAGEPEGRRHGRPAREHGQDHPGQLAAA